VQTGPLISSRCPLSTRPIRIALSHTPGDLKRSPGHRLEIFSLSEADCKGEFFRNRPILYRRYGTGALRAQVPCQQKSRFDFSNGGARCFSFDRIASAATRTCLPDSTEAMILVRVHVLPRCARSECCRCCPNCGGEWSDARSGRRASSPGIQRPANGAETRRLAGT